MENTNFVYPATTTSVAAASPTNPFPSSIELSNDAKDATHYAIKLYFAPGQELRAMNDALDLVGRLRSNLGLPGLPGLPGRGG